MLKILQFVLLNDIITKRGEFMNITLEKSTFSHVISHTISRDDYYSTHVHSHYEILIVLNGNGKFLIEGVEYPFENNSIFLIPPGKYHVMTNLPKKDYERIIIYFKPELLPKFIKSGLYYHKKINLSTRELALKFSEYSKKYSVEILNELIQGFISEILLTEIYEEEFTENQKTFVSPLVKNAIEFINNNIDKPLTTKIIADALFVSHTHLGHAFSKAMNGGLMHYVQIKKIYRAQQLIRQGIPATAVAETLGYKSYPTFIRNYKTYLGITPSEDKR